MRAPLALCIGLCLISVHALKLEAHNASPSSYDLKIASLTRPGPALMAADPVAVRKLLNSRFADGPLKMPNGGTPCEDLSLSELHNIQLELWPLVSPELQSTYSLNGDGIYSHMSSAYKTPGYKHGIDMRKLTTNTIDELKTELDTERVDAAHSGLAMKFAHLHRCHAIAGMWAHQLTSAVREEIIMLDLMKVPLLPKLDFNHHLSFLKL